MTLTTEGKKAYTITGEGTITFDRKLGGINESTMKLKVIGDGSKVVNVSMTCRRLDEHDLAEKLKKFTADPLGVSELQQRHVEELTRGPMASPERAVKEKTEVNVGDMLQAYRGKQWRNVNVLEVLGDGRVKIHWIGYGSELDQTVERSRLRLPPDESSP